MGTRWRTVFPSNLERSFREAPLATSSCTRFGLACDAAAWSGSQVVVEVMPKDNDRCSSSKQNASKRRTEAPRFNADNTPTTSLFSTHDMSMNSWSNNRGDDSVLSVVVVVIMCWLRRRSGSRTRAVEPEEGRKHSNVLIMLRLSCATFKTALGESNFVVVSLLE